MIVPSKLGNRSKKQTSSSLSKNTSISIRIEYTDNVCPPRTSQVRRSSRDNIDAIKANCSNCGKAVYFPKLASYEKLIEVSCCRECEKELDWFNPEPKQETKPVERMPAKIERPKKEKAKRPPCPDCGGEAAKGRGWKHEEGCPRTIKKSKKEKTERPVCPDCGGLPGKVKGWRHEANCPKIAKKSKKKEKLLKQIGMIDPDAAARWKELYSK